MLIKAVILFLALTLIAHSAVISNATETPVPFTDFNNPEFQKVIDAVKNQQTQVAGWRPSRATKQTTNGAKYNFRLTSDLGEVADVVGTVSAQGAISITAFNVIVGRKPTAQRANDPTPTGFKPFTDYANSSFQAALDQAKWQHFYLFVVYKLNKAELFVSNRFYYFRFLFTNRLNASRLIRIIECVSFETPAVPIPQSGFTGAFGYDSPDAFGDNFFAYTELVDYNPSLSIYKIVTAMSQSVNGGNYIFVLEKSVGSYDRKKFVLTSTGSDSHTIAKGADDISEGYSQQVVDQVEALSIRTWKDLQDYKLSFVDNVRYDSTGLRLTFTKGSARKVVELELQGEDETLILYE